MRPQLRTEFLLQLAVELAAPLVIAGVPLGTRRILVATGGSFRGPELQGAVLQCGGDWVLDRHDGVAELDIRFLLRTVDGGLVGLRSFGIFDAPARVRERIRNGEDLDPAQYYFRTCATFETGSDRYRRLNRLVAVGLGRRSSTGMVTDIFEVK